MPHVSPILLPDTDLLMPHHEDSFFFPSQHIFKNYIWTSKTTLQCSTRVPQKPTQDEENDSEEEKVANISSVGDDDDPSRGSQPFPGRRKGR